MGRPSVSDALVALAIGVALQIEIWVFEGGPRGVETVTVGGTLVFAAALAWRRRAPLPAAVAAIAAFALTALLGGHPATTLAMVFAGMLLSFSIGLHVAGRTSVMAAGAFLLAGWLDIVVTPAAEYAPLSDMAFTAVIIVAGPWFAGRALRGWRDRAAELERLTEHVARFAVLDERARIAREMHDVVAHSVSLMVVQAGGARRMLDEDVEESRAALQSIEEAGRQALQELRRSLGMLRDGGVPADLAPQPGMAEIAELVERTRASGLPVELTVEGEPRPLAPGVDLAAYRIVQEALTNTIKHAGPARARVALRWQPRALELTVSDDGRGAGGARNGAGPGHGLIGMRERVAAYGGTLTSGAAGDGGYEVRARIPLGEPS